MYRKKTTLGSRASRVARCAQVEGSAAPTNGGLRAHLRWAVPLSALLLGACQQAGTDERRDSGVAALPDGSAPPPPPDAGVEQCGDAPVSTAAFTRRGLLEAAASCATYHYCQFTHEAGALTTKLRALQSDPSELRRQEAQDAWRAAMASWSRAELFQFGPAGTRAIDPYHGQSLRTLIYAWPNTSRCRVEEQIASQAYQSDFSRVLVNGRGLYAVEYGLFFEATDTACAASSATGMAWPALAAADLAARKVAYAQAAAEDVYGRAYQLHETWKPEGGNFGATLASATGYPNEQEALNVVAWSMIYLEKEIKDWKLGIPAGYTTMAPVSEGESPYARAATENLRANLQGFRALFQGCGPQGEGIGFDDWLTEAGHPELAAEIVAATADAQAAMDAAPPLHEATAEQLEALYQVIKRLTDLLKQDLFGTGSPLNLKLPASVEGDTD